MALMVGREGTMSASRIVCEIGVLVLPASEAM